MVISNQTWREVRGRTSRRYLSRVDKTARGFPQAFAPIHLKQHRSAAVFPIRVDLRAHRLGVELAENDLHLEEIILAFSFNSGRTESERLPMRREFGLPFQ